MSFCCFLVFVVRLVFRVCCVVDVCSVRWLLINGLCVVCCSLRIVRCALCSLCVVFVVCFVCCVIFFVCRLLFVARVGCCLLLCVCSLFVVSSL